MFAIAEFLYAGKHWVWRRAGSYGGRYINRMERMRDGDHWRFSVFCRIFVGSVGLQEGKREKPYTFSSISDGWIGGVLCCMARGIKMQGAI